MGISHTFRCQNRQACGVTFDLSFHQPVFPSPLRVRCPLCGWGSEAVGASVVSNSTEWIPYGVCSIPGSATSAAEAIRHVEERRFYVEVRP